MPYTVIPMRFCGLIIQVVHQAVTAEEVGSGHVTCKFIKNLRETLARRFELFFGLISTNSSCNADDLPNPSQGGIAVSGQRNAYICYLNFCDMSHDRFQPPL